MKLVAGVLLVLSFAGITSAANAQSMVINVNLSDLTLNYKAVDRNGKVVTGNTQVLPQRANQQASRRIPRGTFTVYHSYANGISRTSPRRQMADVLLFKGGYNIQSSASWSDRMVRGQFANGAIIIPKSVGEKLYRYAQIVGQNNVKIVVR